MRVVLSAGVDPETYLKKISHFNIAGQFTGYTYSLTIDPNIYPAKMEVDYFKYYQLKGDCSGNISQCNYNFSTHTNTVKNSYELKCNTIEPLASNYNFRAATGITLNDNFEVPLGTEFLADCSDYCKKNTIFITNNCGFVFNPCDYDFSSYSNDVKKYIEISGNNCNAIVNPINNVKLHAVDYINLKAGFAVPLNSEVEIKTTNCSN